MTFDLFYKASSKWPPLNFRGGWRRRQGGGTKALLRVAVSEILPHKPVLFYSFTNVFRDDYGKAEHIRCNALSIRLVIPTTSQLMKSS